MLVFPEGLEEFDDYLGFLDDAQTVLEEMGLAGEIQIASFHPDYRFEGEPVDAVSHFTNRAPYPLIHLLRETMVSTALENYPNPERIPERNIQTLERLGLAAIERLLNSLDAKELRLSGCLRRIAIDHVLVQTPPRQEEEEGTGGIETGGDQHG